MSYVAQKSLLSVVCKVMIPYVGAKIGIGSGFYGGRYEFASGASAQSYGADVAGG